MGKSTINGPFSIAMLNYQRVNTSTSIFAKYPRGDPLNSCPPSFNLMAPKKLIKKRKRKAPAPGLEEVFRKKKTCRFTKDMGEIENAKIMQAEKNDTAVLKVKSRGVTSGAVSVAIILENREGRIPPCIPSIPWADYLHLMSWNAHLLLHQSKYCSWHTWVWMMEMRLRSFDHSAYQPSKQKKQYWPPSRFIGYSRYAVPSKAYRTRIESAPDFASSYKFRYVVSL